MTVSVADIESPLRQEPVTLVLLGRAVPSNPPNHTRNGIRIIPARQTQAVAELKLAASKVMQGRRMLEGPIAIDFLAEVPIPQSFSKKKRLAAILGEIYPTKKPDLKNLAALAEDALRNVVYPDDNVVCRHTNAKLYGVQPKIIMTVRVMEPGELCRPHLAEAAE